MPEDPFPIDITLFQLRNSGVSPIRAAKRRADAETTLGKVHPVAHIAADTVVFCPFDVRLIDAALIDQILNETPDRVVRQRGDDGRVKPETAFEAACDVVFAAALPNLEGTRRVDALIARIEPEHYLTERNDVPFTIVF